MFIRNLNSCKEIVAGDNTTLREILNPLKDELSLKYSLAHAIVKPGKTTLMHKIRGSEVYYILQGQGVMHIGNESEKICKGQAVYIPPMAAQSIENTGKEDLVFLCIVDPAWKKENEEIIWQRK